MAAEGVRAWTVFGELNLVGMPGVLTDLERFESKGRRVLSQVLGLEGGMLAMSAAVAAVGTGLLVASYKAAMFADNVERSIRRAAQMMPGATTQVGYLNDAVSDLARTVPLPFETLLAGLQAAARGAQAPADAILKLRAASALAAGTGAELDQVIRTQTQAMNAYNIPATQAARVTDLFAAAAQHGVALDELNPILERNAARAHAAGISFEQLIQFIIQLRESGVSYREIGAIISTALGQTTQETDRASAGMGRLSARLVQTQEGWKLVGQGAKLAAEAQQAVATAAGAADRMLRAETASAEAQAQLVRNNLSVAWKDFGTNVLPAVTWSFKQLNEVVEYWTGATKFNLLAQQLRDLGTAFAALPKEQTGLDVLLNGPDPTAAAKARQYGEALGPLKDWIMIVRDSGKPAAIAWAELLKPGLLNLGDIARISVALKNLTDNELAALGVTRKEVMALQAALRALPETPTPTPGRPEGGGGTKLPPTEAEINEHNRAIIAAQDADIQTWLRGAQEHKQIEDATNAYLLATGWKTHEERMTEIQFELEAWDTSTLRRIELETELFNLTHSDTTRRIEDAKQVAATDKEAAIASLEAWREALRERGQLYPELERQIDRAIVDIRTMKPKAGAIGNEIGKTLIQGAVRGIIENQDWLKSTLLTIVEAALTGVILGILGLPGGIPGLNAVTTAAGAAGGGGMAGGLPNESVVAPHLSASLEVGNLPPPSNPLAASRDAEWLRFLGASTLELRAAGFR